MGVRRVSVGEIAGGKEEYDQNKFCEILKEETNVKSKETLNGCVIKPTMYWCTESRKKRVYGKAYVCGWDTG